MYKLKNLNCSICNSNNAYIISDIKAKWNITVNLSICRTCGFVYLNPRWPKDKYDEFYQERYDHLANRKIASRIDESVASTILNRLQEFKPGFTPGSILDIGAGFGETLTYLKKNAFLNAGLFAVEPSQNARDNLRKNGINIVSNYIEDLDDQVRQYDLIILRHVIEHIFEPIEALLSISSMLSKNGLLYIAVPNVEQPKRPFIKQFLRVVHLSYFSPRSLQNAALLSNLKSEKLVIGDEANPHEIYGFFTQDNESNTQGIEYEDPGKIIKSILELIKEENHPAYKLNSLITKWINILHRLF